MATPAHFSWNRALKATFGVPSVVRVRHPASKQQSAALSPFLNLIPGRQKGEIAYRKRRATVNHSNQLEECGPLSVTFLALNTL